MERLRVAVLFGGRSGEHEVSLMSAQSVIAALDPDRYEVIPVGIAKDGRWLVGGDPLAALKEGLRQLPPNTVPTTFAPDPSSPGLIPLSPEPELDSERQHFDIVFPVLHGPYGEDGTVQGLLELANVPYVGSGVAASAAGMDKALMKGLFKGAGLPILDYMVLKSPDLSPMRSELAEEIGEKLGYPCFVKPANLGSSVGVNKVESPEELSQALKEAARYDRKVIVEKAAEGYREIECSVLGNDDPIASVPGEIRPKGGFYDYRAKYIDNTSELIIPAQLSSEAVKRVQELAIQAFLAIDGAGLARVDFFVHPDTEEVVINEINTMPGFTPISMYPKLWEASGLPYPQLIDRLIELGFERHREKNSLQISYEG